jgi:hypothetical protein
MRWIHVAGLASLVGCHADKPPVMPVSEAWLQITDGHYAREHAHRTAHTALPFAFTPGGVNGTQLILQFLGTAETKGARYASDLAIVMQLTHNGQTVECVSKIVIDDSKPPAPVPEAAPTDGENTTTIHPWHPDKITAQVDDHDFVCARKGDEISAVWPQMETDYMADDLRLDDLPPAAPARIATSSWHDDCHLQSAHRTVTRYEHFVAAHFEPPDWTKIGKAFAERPLIELPPECHEIATPAHTVQRIEGDLSYDGNHPEYRVKPLTRPQQAGT